MKRYTQHEVIKKIEDAASQYRSRKEYAESLGTTEQFLSNVINKRRNPSKRMTDTLGLQKDVTFIPIQKETAK